MAVSRKWHPVKGIMGDWRTKVPSSHKLSKNHLIVIEAIKGSLLEPSASINNFVLRNKVNNNNFAVVTTENSSKTIVLFNTYETKSCFLVHLSFSTSNISLNKNTCSLGKHCFRSRNLVQKKNTCKKTGSMTADNSMHKKKRDIGASKIVGHRQFLTWTHMIVKKWKLA